MNRVRRVRKKCLVFLFELFLIFKAITKWSWLNWTKLKNTVDHFFCLFSVLCDVSTTLLDISPFCFPFSENVRKSKCPTIRKFRKPELYSRSENQNLRKMLRANFGSNETWCQFHEHFTRNFFYESVFLSFSLHVITVWLDNFWSKEYWRKSAL